MVVERGAKRAFETADEGGTDKGHEYSGEVSIGAGVVDRLCQGLDYLDADKNWIALPSWSQFFLRIGMFLATGECSRAGDTVVVALPTRAYASLFGAAGVVASRARQTLEGDLTEHIAMLRSEMRRALTSQDGDGYVTVVSRSDARRYTVGWLRGISSHGGEEYFDISVAKDGLVRIPLRKAGRVELAERQMARLPGSIKVKTVRGGAGIMGDVLSADEAGQFVGQARTECVIVGSGNRLFAEVASTALSFRAADGRRTNGTIDDIIRLRQGRAGATCYRSEIVSADHPVRHSFPGKPRVVLFDGASAFLKWRTVWPDTPWLVILDQTEPRFVDATLEVETLFLARSADLSVKHLPTVPASAELVAFTR